MPNRYLRIALMLAGLMLLESPRNPEATMWPAPVRPLSNDEQVEYAVSRADAILIGRIEAYNGVRISIPDTPRLGPWDHYLIVRPDRWIKGSPTDSLVRVEAGWLSELAQVRDSSDRYFFFLEKWIDRASGKSRWVLNSPKMFESPYTKLKGMGKMTDAPEGLPDGAADAVARQSLKSLAYRADLIILGAPTKLFANCQSYERSRRCPRYRVISDIAGTAPGDTVNVFAWIPGLEPYREAIIFARRVPDGSYELLSAAAGGMMIENGIVQRTGLPVAKQVAEIRDSLKIWKAIH